MADNVTASAGTGDGASFATDDIGGVHYTRVKVTWGTDGIANDASASNPLPVVQTGTLNVGTVTAVTAISNALPAGDNNIGNVDVASIAAGSNSIGGTFPRPETANGLSIFRSIDLDESQEEVKASAGQVYGWFITNLSNADVFVKFYNATAANVTVGTTTPVMTIAVPGNSTDSVAANALGTHGIAFSTAITVAATTGVADNDTTGPGANEVVVNLFYK